MGSCPAPPIRLPLAGIPDPTITIEAGLAGSAIAAQIVRYDIPGPTDSLVKPDDSYQVNMCLTPRPLHARACYEARWGPHRFERLGDIFLVPPGEVLRFRGDRGRQSSLTCQLRPRLLAELVGRDLVWDDRQLATTLDITNARVRALLFRLTGEVRYPGFASERMLELFGHELAIEIARYCLEVHERPATGGLASWRLRLIDERLAGEHSGDSASAPTLGDLAALCNISTRQLTRGFRVSRGCSLGDAIEQRRMEAAKRLLGTGESVKGVAFAMGFASPSSFTFAFRRAIGVSPSQFRQRRLPGSLAQTLSAIGPLSKLWLERARRSRCQGFLRDLSCSQPTVMAKAGPKQNDWEGTATMAEHLSAAAIIDEAHANTGLSDFDSDSYREGLDVLVDDVYVGIGKDWYTESGLKRIHNDAVHYLATRLKIADYLKHNPELLERRIERPVFVMGVPRTGTTLMANLLAADPARRSPLTWEIDDPVPPATGAALKTDPRALVRLEQEMIAMAANPDMGKYYRGSAIYPNEDVFIMAGDFKTLMIESKGRLPAYKDFIFSCDMTSSYEYHKKFIQVLQSQAPGVWNLKKPSHALYLEYLFKVYPDARVIWTHRDPYTATGSLCSIISLSHMGHMGRIDTEWLGEDYSWQAAEHANRIMDFRDKHGEDTIIDVHYADLVRDPIGVMKQVYAALGDDFTPAAEAGIQGWLDDNPQGKFGRHEYQLDRYGLSKQQLEPLFERYLSRYDVAREG